jgi:hypothetical protein
MEGALLKEAVLPSLGQCNTVSHTYLPLYFNSWPHDISTLGPTDEKRDNNHTYKTTACLYFHSCLHESERTDSRAKDAKGTSASLSHWPTRASKCKSSTSLITTLLSLKSSIQSGRNTLGVSFLFLSSSQRWHDSWLITTTSIPLSPQSVCLWQESNAQCVMRGQLRQIVRISLHIAVGFKVPWRWLSSLFWYAGEICSSEFDIWIEEKSAMEFMKSYSAFSKTTRQMYLVSHSQHHLQSLTTILNHSPTQTATFSCGPYKSSTYERCLWNCGEFHPQS